jgi:hypothetical protein
MTAPRPNQPPASLADVDDRINSLRALRRVAASRDDVLRVIELSDQIDKTLQLRHDMQRQEAA